MADFNEFPCEVVNIGEDYVDIKYSRNGEDGKEDKSFFAISRFSADEIADFDKVKKGKGTLQIAHAPLTEELLRYEQNKQAVEK